MVWYDSQWFDILLLTFVSCSSTFAATWATRVQLSDVSNFCQFSRCIRGLTIWMAIKSTFLKLSIVPEPSRCSNELGQIGIKIIIWYLFCERFLFTFAIVSFLKSIVSLKEKCQKHVLLKSSTLVLYIKLTQSSNISLKYITDKKENYNWHRIFFSHENFI